MDWRFFKSKRGFFIFFYSWGFRGCLEVISVVFDLVFDVVLFEVIGRGDGWRVV